MKFRDSFKKQISLCEDQRTEGSNEDNSLLVSFSEAIQFVKYYSLVWSNQLDFLFGLACFWLV